MDYRNAFNVYDTRMIYEQLTKGKNPTLFARTFFIHLIEGGDRLKIPETDVRQYGYDRSKFNIPISSNVKDVVVQTNENIITCTVKRFKSTGAKSLIKFVVPERVWDRLLEEGGREAATKVMVTYYCIGISNEFLSVSPDLVKEWGITVEMFAAPFNNTVGKFYSAFPETEKIFGSLGTFQDAVFDKKEVYLCNPPYDVEIINFVYNKLEPYLGKGYKIALVIPIWDHEGRKELGLQLYDDMPVVAKFKKLAKDVKAYESFPFYDYVKDVNITKGIPVYVMTFD